MHAKLQSVQSPFQNMSCCMQLYSKNNYDTKFLHYLKQNFATSKYTLSKNAEFEEDAVSLEAVK